jgi:1,5-anhydro-D-fructose reductase (1,5-anhydro-D-mannitol-forming)
MNDMTVRWLLVGGGDIARKRVAPALHESPHSRLVAVCDRVEERARQLAADFGGGKTYTEYDAALADSGIDAVYVATPVHLHEPMARRALDAGKHVLVEKPLGIDRFQAEKLADLEKKTTLVTGCAYYRRFYPRYQMLREMIAGGEFGRIVMVRMVYCSWFHPLSDDPKFWRVRNGLSGGGPLSDMGTHMFDLLIGLFGMPTAISAMTATLDRDWDVEDSAAAWLRLANGALGTFNIHWNSKTWRHLFEVTGTEARVLWEPFDAGPVVKTVGRETRSIALPEVENVHQPLVEDFVNAVREGGRATVTFTEAAKTNRFLDAVYRSAIEHREIKP